MKSKLFDLDNVSAYFGNVQEIQQLFIGGNKSGHEGNERWGYLKRKGYWKTPLSSAQVSLLLETFQIVSYPTAL